MFALPGMLAERAGRPPAGGSADAGGRAGAAGVRDRREVRLRALAPRGTGGVFFGTGLVLGWYRWGPAWHCANRRLGLTRRGRHEIGFEYPNFVVAAGWWAGARRSRGAPPVGADREYPRGGRMAKPVVDGGWVGERERSRASGRISDSPLRCGGESMHGPPVGHVAAPASDDPGD